MRAIGPARILFRPCLRPPSYPLRPLCAQSFRRSPCPLGPSLRPPCSIFLYVLSALIPHLPARPSARPPPKALEPNSHNPFSSKGLSGPGKSRASPRHQRHRIHRRVCVKSPTPGFPGASPLTRFSSFFSRLAALSAAGTLLPGTCRSGLPPPPLARSRRAPTISSCSKPRPPAARLSYRFR